ncbi:hypothetical protein BRC83_02275 [Halobacteriales archaeon QS_1_68_17]|nr:MAG: hypothetical protein BRC83_02275 [Halobacteriales archaeon QS_1_68_17]
MLPTALPAGQLLHLAPEGSPAVVLLAVLALSTVGSALVVGLSLSAFVRRGSWSYLLVTLALATLLARSGVTVLTMQSVIPTGVHHLLEHALDVAMAALVIAAVYTARTARRRALERDHLEGDHE